MMADFGYDTYSTTIETSQKLVDENPDLVQRFVNATIEGWYNYLYGDNTQANELIKNDNPEITDEQIAFSIAAMKEYGIVDSGDAADHGHRRDDRCALGELLRPRSMVWGVYPADLPYKNGYTTAVRRTRATASTAEASSPASEPRSPATAPTTAPGRAAAGRPARGRARCSPTARVALAGLDLAIGRREFVSLLGPRAAARARRCG